MATKYLTLRAEFVEGDNSFGELCEICIFGVNRRGDLLCGIQNHPKSEMLDCAKGYWK